LARPVAAAGRVDRDAVPARGVEQVHPGGHPRFAAGRLEAQDDPAPSVVAGGLVELDVVGNRHAPQTAVCVAAADRNCAIQLAPHGSLPSSRSLAWAAITHSGARAFMI